MITLAAQVVVGFAFGFAVMWAIGAVLDRLRRNRADTLLREHLLERYVVTLLSGESFSGLLAGVDDRTLVLRDADVLSAEQPKKVDGDMVLRRDSIAYMQRPAT